MKEPTTLMQMESVCHRLIAENDELKARLASEHRRLAEYGRHWANCTHTAGFMQCSCGLSAALEFNKPKEVEE